MVTFKVFLTEETKITGKIKPYEKIVYNAMVEYLKDKFNISGDVTLRVLKKLKLNQIGYVDISKLKEGRYIVTAKNGGINVTFFTMKHEFTHLQQYITHKLGADGDMITWNGEPYTSASEYKRMEYKQHSKLPWEVEAIKNSKDKSFDKEFEKSDYYINMRGKDPTLDYLMDEKLIMF